ncbi:hypothetical protein DFA_05057 [Cavenderia fasciculata]|uniref:PH domain-containing protein n=1 Tax=Cavenderia fasciculata TaxID=261658 RepID=F4PN74_CACFS|nr:uncharacterized protein DFA_05057 [Cavenderia fasciculata]EGG22927.1 hypothetical protein DFA_05057 [Cavenderia fasciculata]|eukprot:XP_004360778.1 hypothetical protein DFA_05057 [Cavenderia fasciculata]
MEMENINAYTCQVTVNTHYINSDGIDKGWISKYVDLSEGGMEFKESAEDTIRRGLLYLHDIVYCEQADEPGAQPYNLRIKTRGKATYTFELPSQEMFNSWTALIERHKGVMREEDINPPPPHKAVKEKVTFYKWWCDSWNYCERQNNYMVIATIVYIILWAVLLTLLWILFVQPMKNITQVKTQCYVLSHDYEYLYKRTYNLIMDVRYTLENGTVMRNEMVQYCAGSDCPDDMEDKYPLNEYTTCYYDKDDIDFVFFDLGAFLKKKYSIVGGVCGGLLAPWLIFVVVYLFVKGKDMVKVLKNGCF